MTSVAWLFSEMASDSDEMSEATATPSGDESVLPIRQCGFAVLALFAVVAFVFLFTGYFGYSQHGIDGLVTAMAAGLLCFAAASAALVVTALSTNTPNALSGVLLGIVLRTAVPFLMSILLMQAFKPLADAGLLGMVLINYLVVLAAETVLAVRIVQAHSSTVVRQ